MFRRNRMNPAAEYAELERERAILSQELKNKRSRSEMMKQIKADRRELKALKNELHPSVYRRFGHLIKESATYTMEERRKLKKLLQKEKAHARKRRKAVKRIS